MRLDVLMSCMHQKDAGLVERSRITGSVTVINQCDREDFQEYSNGRVKMYSTTDRGLTKSRNLAIAKSDADICVLCDDDETFVDDYENKILTAYEQLPQADVIIFNMVNRPSVLGDDVRRIRFPQTMHVSSWQISFRRESLLRSGIRFDELLGAGSGNGAEEELKFLKDCEKAGLQIWYVPAKIASVAQTESTWFKGFDETFFYNRGATTRYILGLPLAAAYGCYYVLRKKGMYSHQIAPGKAFAALMRGIRENRISAQAAGKK